MSVTTSTMVWTYSRSQGVRLLALAAMADIADDEGLCWPSVEYLAGKLRQAERYTRMVLRDLKQEGELYVIPRSGWNSKVRRKSNAYIIMAGMDEERFVRACRHDPLNYSEAYARELYRAIPAGSVPADVMFSPRREQNAPGDDNGRSADAAGYLHEPRYDRFEVNPAQLPADNPDQMIRGNNLEGENNPDDMIRVGTTNPDHMIPTTLIKRSPDTSLDTIGGGGVSFSPIPVLENDARADAQPATLTEAAFRELKNSLRGVMVRATYNDLIAPAGMPAQERPGYLILHVPTEQQAERINNMLAPVIEAHLPFVGGALGMRVRAVAAASPRSAGNGKMPAAVRTSVPALRQDPRAEELPF